MNCLNLKESNNKLSTALKILIMISLVLNMYMYSIKGIQSYYNTELFIRLILFTIVLLMIVTHSQNFKNAYLEYNFRQSGIECSDGEIVKYIVSRSSSSKLNTYTLLNTVYVAITLYVSILMLRGISNALTISRTLFIGTVLQTIYAVILFQYEEILAKRLKQEKEIKEHIKEV